MNDQNAAPQGVQTEGFPGEVGRWKPVPAGKLGSLPYSRICQIVGVGGGSSGTGWLHAKRQILTAAHVVAGAHSVRVRFADRADWIAAKVGKIAQGYFGPGGEERPCSPWDLALIVPPADVAVGAGILAPISGSLCLAVGFRDGVLVEHAGTGTDVGPFVAHNCDTDHEHSGCPVFTANGVWGIHVGMFAGSRTYLQPPQSQTQGYLNSAVRLNGALVASLVDGEGE